MDHAVDHGNVEHGHNGAGGHEHREANLKLIVFSAIGLAISVAAVMLLMWGTFNLLKKDEQAHEKNVSPLAAPYQLPPEPRLQDKPWEELPRLREYENKMLSGYTWQDQKAGTVRIPIDQAMDMVAQRGFPAPSPAAAPKPGVKSGK